MIVAAGLLAVGCANDRSTDSPPSSTTPHPSTAPTPITAPGPKAGDSAEAVAAAAMKELYTLRPATESPGDSLTRIRGWLSLAMLARIGSLTAPAASLEWAGWAGSGAQVDAKAFVSAERPPSEEPGLASRKVGVSQTVSWPDGHSESRAPFTVVVDLIDTPAGWRVDDYRSW
ncbi:hypothetical protein [Nocardia sp. IFM 10818]